MRPDTALSWILCAALLWLPVDTPAQDAAFGTGSAAPKPVAQLLSKARVLKERRPELFGAAQGLLVTQVLPDSQAAEAGLATGDVLVAYDDVPLDSRDQLVELTRRAAEDQRVALRLVRGRTAIAVEICGGRIGVGIANLDPDANFPTDPILRLNPEGHFAQIWRIETDVQGRWLVSGGDDKQVKVWRLADGTLERTLRLPQGAGDLGKIRSVAISPDGAQVAVGGWTGSADGLNTTIYIFDRATGTLVRRIEGLPNVIYHLSFLPDGKRLVAMLWGANGMRLYGTDDYREGARDFDYGDQSYWAAFAVDGGLVTSSLDGKVRLYDPDGGLVQTAEAPGGEQPYGVAFSPDGSRIAVGYHDSTRVDVLDSASLELLYSADNAGADSGNLMSVAWSADGRILLAGGRYDDNGSNPIRRWSEAGRGSFEDLKVATNTVMTLRPLADGGLAIGAQDRVALLSPDGETA